jgi:hypothetical protein
MNKLEWFKFSPSNWAMGKISRLSMAMQGEFMRFCCIYWNKDCDISVEDARTEFNQKTYDTLTRLNILKEREGVIVINFLIEQLREVDRIREIASRAGKASAEARKLKATVTVVQPNPTEKKENNRKDIYRSFAHLQISKSEFIKLTEEYSSDTVDAILDAIENYEGNKHYKSLYLTAKTWLRDKPKKVDNAPAEPVTDNFAANVMKQVSNVRNKG